MLTLVHKYLLGLTATLLLATCHSKQDDITPTPNFSYSFATPALKALLPGYAVGTGIKLTNTSTDAVSYRWDLGDGNSSVEKEPTIAYSQSGTYTITLTTTSPTGTQRVVSQSIKILDCVLKKITISDFTWNSIGEVPSWDERKKADLSLEFGQHADNDLPLTISHSLYKSDPVKNVGNIASSFPIAVTQKVLLNPSVLTNFIVDLYGNDGSGNRVVFSSNATVVGYSAHLSTKTGLYTITSGPITLEGSYE